MRDAIERSIRIAAPREAVWRALVDAGEFGTWFRARVEGPFETGRLVWLESTYPGHEGVRFWIVPVALDRPARFAFDWPADDPPIPADRAGVKTTRVTFALTEEEGGTRVTVTETGFAALPPDLAGRRYPENAGGWEIQLANIKRHVEA